MTATDIKATLLAVLDRVAGGEEVEITKRGRVVARLVPARGPEGLRGCFADRAQTVDPADDLLSTGAQWQLS